eukprot:1432476-Rhodomonas_salina.2
MSGTDLAYNATCLRVRYTMSGTEVGDAATSTILGPRPTSGDGNSIRRAAHSTAQGPTTGSSYDRSTA